MSYRHFDISVGKCSSIQHNGGVYLYGMCLDCGGRKYKNLPKKLAKQIDISVGN